MKTFQITRSLTAVCQWRNRRNGFAHEATLVNDGADIAHKRVNYINRTWESYEFQSVLYSLAEVAKDQLSTRSYNIFAKKIKNNFRKAAHKEVQDHFRSVAMVAKIGEIFTGNKKESNDWKSRMIKAGINLEMPEDWDQISEEEKEQRLNKVINEMTKE